MSHPFLCEQYSFSRWIKDVPEVTRNEEFYKQIKKAVLIVPSNADLKTVKQEKAFIDKFTKDTELELDTIFSYAEVVHMLREGEFDMIHFATHGFHNDKNPLLSVLTLDGGDIRPNDIYGDFGRSSPLVFLNACQTGKQGFSFTKAVGWAEKFITAGCSGFIGTLWSVSDETAAKFTSELYEELRKGTPLGEAVKFARNNCKIHGDPSWLAYQMYGHPSFKFRFGESPNILQE